MRHGRADRPDGPGDVRVEHRGQRLVGVVEDPAVHPDPGVRHQGVEAAEALERGIDQPLAVGRDPDIHRDRGYSVGKLSLELVEALAASGAEHNPCAYTEQFPSGGTADSCACSGDDDDLVLE